MVPEDNFEEYESKSEEEFLEERISGAKTGFWGGLALGISFGIIYILNHAYSFQENLLCMDRLISAGGFILALKDYRQWKNLEAQLENYSKTN